MASMKLAIVGGGPSAFYVASRILSLTSLANQPPLRIHMFDRLWAPHGLVRYGVAPDHPEVKNCTHKFDASAADPRFRFFGNVNVGDTAATIQHTVQLPLQSIFSNYSHVLFATGCTLPTLHPSLSPSEYCMPAISLVHWYTRHPTCPTPPPLERTSHVSLIGNGNVSLDVARMLLTPVSVLEKYDVPAPVLDVLARSQVKHVSIIGRRGPLEAAFTTKELRELMNLPDAAMVPLPPSILDPPPPANGENSPAPTRQQARILQLLRQGSKNSFGITQKTWSLDFFRAPMHLSPPTPGSSLAHLTLAHTALDPTHSRAIATGETSIIPTSLVITSLGFHGEPGSFHDSKTNLIRTTAGGRVIAPSSQKETALRNIYASGWAATGAKGVLAATMLNAYSVADTILSDWLPGENIQTTANGVYAPPEDAQLLSNPSPNLEQLPAEVEDGLKAGLVTQYKDWKRIDAEEIRRGSITGKERERMRWEDAKAFLEQ